MKIKYLFLIFTILCCTVGLQAQTLSNDTIICIVDTTKNYVTYKEKVYRGESKESYWHVSIKGHYYDNSLNAIDAKFASIGFSTSYKYRDWVKGPYIIAIPTQDMEERYTVVNDKWVHKENDFYELKKNLAFTPWSKYNFLVFKQDLDSCTDGFVKAYRVLVGYSEVQY